MMQATVERATEALRMVRLRLDAAGLVNLARRRRLPLRDLDEGYIAHCALVELFGPSTIMPFVIEDATQRAWSILGYTMQDTASLTARARAAADPRIWQICDWSTLADKPMPLGWPEGARLSFRVRACPIQRMASAGPFHRKGAEVDVFLARCWSAGQGGRVDRSAVYADWLERQLSGAGAVRSAELTVEGVRRMRLLRRSQGSERVAASCERPEVHFRGDLVIGDSSAFDRLIRRGVGRHRAFGFGMLRLAHPSRGR